MADNPQELQPRLAKATYEDLTTMIENEEKERLQIIDQGVNPTNHILMENKKDDERQCDYCKTTCFLSALICECSTRKYSVSYSMLNEFLFFRQNGLFISF